MQSTVPLVDLATLGTLVGAGRRGVRRPGRPDAQSASTGGDRNAGAVAGATVESCKAQVSSSVDDSPRRGGTER